MKKYICEKCGSDDVWIESHYYPNTKETIQMCYQEENNFCNQCEDWTNLTKENEEDGI